MAEVDHRPWTIPEFQEETIPHDDIEAEAERKKLFEPEASVSPTEAATPQESAASVAESPEAEVSDKEFKYHWEQDMKGFRQSYQAFKTQIVTLRELQAETDAVNLDLLVEVGDFYWIATEKLYKLEEDHINASIPEIRARLFDRSQKLDKWSSEMLEMTQKCQAEIKRVNQLVSAQQAETQGSDRSL